MKIVKGERLDLKVKPLVNCNGCYYKVGKLCTYHRAYTQSNPHKPTDCPHWIEKKEYKES